MGQNETNDERQPVLDRIEIKEIVDQVSRPERDVQDLLTESGKKSSSSVRGKPYCLEWGIALCLSPLYGQQLDK